MIGRSTEYYTSQSYRPTQKLSESGKTGPATVIISGIGLGMLSTAIPVIAVVVGIIASFLLASGFDFSNVGMGLYGIGIAAVGMLSTLGITLATDAYGPVSYTHLIHVSGVLADESDGSHFAGVAEPLAGKWIGSTQISVANEPCDLCDRVYR